MLHDNIDFVINWFRKIFQGCRICTTI